MQSLLLHRTHAEPIEPAPAHILAPLLQQPTQEPMRMPARAKSPRNSNLDSLLKVDRELQAESAADLLELDPTPGIFLGLRVALLFNAGLGIAALLAYETWTMMTR